MNDSIQTKDTQEIIRQAKNAGNHLSIMFEKATRANYNDVSQNIICIARLVERAIYNYFYLNVFNEKIDICNINMSNIDTTNIDEKDKSNYILGYEFGILESYVKDTFEIVSGDKTVFKYIASIKTNLKCFAENSSNNEKEILCNIKALCDIMSKLNALLNNNSYSAIKLDEINQIKEQLARVCKAYINCNILINNIR